MYNRTDTHWVPTSHSRTKLPEETEENHLQEEEEEEAAVVDGERGGGGGGGGGGGALFSLSLIWRKVIEVRPSGC